MEPIPQFPLTPRARRSSLPLSGRQVSGAGQHGRTHRAERAKRVDEVADVDSARPPNFVVTAGAGSLPTARDVFVIHGRDEQLRERFFEFLRAIDLRPLEWEAIVTATGQTAPPLLTVIRTALMRAQAIVAL